MARVAICLFCEDVLFGGEFQTPSRLQNVGICIKIWAELGAHMSVYKVSGEKLTNRIIAMSC